MIVPRLIVPGDRVKVIAPSGIVNRVKCEEGISLLKDWGLMAERGKNIYNRYGIFAGTDEQRLHDLQDSLDDPGIKAIFCARGGYGLSRIIDRINLAKFLKSPKWVIGFSDITLLHLWINMGSGVATLHGEMVANFSNRKKSAETLSTLKRTLFEGAVEYLWDTENYSPGIVEGIITGGNLSLLCNLTGTALSKWLDGKILFIEETGEFLYRFDRMLSNLRLSGIFERISGMVIGGLTGMEDTKTHFGRKIEDIVMDAVSSYGFPVAMDFPAGHQDDNRAFMSGSKVRFSVNNGKAELKYI
jgi:muramoyltetrapeptide carboxypeptidase